MLRKGKGKIEGITITTHYGPHFGAKFQFSKFGVVFGPLWVGSNQPFQTPLHCVMKRLEYSVVHLGACVTSPPKLIFYLVKYPFIRFHKIAVFTPI